MKYNEKKLFIYLFIFTSFPGTLLQARRVDRLSRLVAQTTHAMVCMGSNLKSPISAA